MLKERNRFQKEVQLLTETVSEPAVLSHSEGRQFEIKDSSSRVSARILYPALGFPAVIAPTDGESRNPSLETDATRCLCILLVSDIQTLSQEAAARHLRYVPWKERGRRHIPYQEGEIGTFRKEDLKVSKPKVLSPKPNKGDPTDIHGQIILFGANSKGDNGIVVNLPEYVSRFYKNIGLGFLYEIRVSETACRVFDKPLYHIFWNNKTTNESVPSDEMLILLQKFAKPRREKLGILWKKHSTHLLDEYRYEYGSLHLPYRGKSAPSKIPTEILHPVFVRRSKAPVLKIAHLTDTHVHTKADVFEENLRLHDPIALKHYLNWNKHFESIYMKSKIDSNILLLTGDLIDYGRGYWGLDELNGLGDNGLYHSDRNWFLFYYLLASGERYTNPVYTSLGNHDWRLNPYPPFSPGAPIPSYIFTGLSTVRPNKHQDSPIEKALKTAHGPGSDIVVSYTYSVEKKYSGILKAFLNKVGGLEIVRQFGRLKDKSIITNLFKGYKTLNRPGFPSETKLESVEWYLLCINPFLDYIFTLPTGHSVLMLDWAEGENVVWPSTKLGRQAAVSLDLTKFPPVDIDFSWDEGPKARNCLTALQVKLAEIFANSNGNAKIIGIHSPPIGPWHDWYSKDLRLGFKKYDPVDESTFRGYPNYRANLSNNGEIRGHPLFSIKPRITINWPAVEGMDASYGSFEQNRSWFIRFIAERKYHIRLVLSGHIHRQDLFVTYKSKITLGREETPEMFIQSIFPRETHGVPSFAGANLKLSKTSNEPDGLVPGPLYVNSTSIGPLGHFYVSKGEEIHMPPGYSYIELVNDGTIKKVEFRSMQIPIT
jgi:predicted MPP superfamily phosphohydrolase